ncbi:MAG: hypothetical protein WCO89_06530 [Syntrophus sp. (in: bacteria)]
MGTTIWCLQCKEWVKRNPRIKQRQHYCGKPACRKAWKRQWQKRRFTNDPHYRHQQKESQKQWREHKPAHEYQSRYRAAHPEYEEKNRQLQHKRNEKRKLSKVSDVGLIVNMDSLQAEGIVNHGVYALVPVGGEKIVNMDSLWIKMQHIWGIAGHLLRPVRRL